MESKKAQKLMSDIFDVYDRLIDLTDDYPESMSVDRALTSMGYVYEDVQMFLQGIKLEKEK
jgi:hypothetical protein